MTDTRISTPAVLVAALIGMGIGMVWYSPSMFESQWYMLSGLSHQQVAYMMAERGYVVVMVIAFLAMFVKSFALAWLIDRSDPSGLGEGLAVGFWTWALIITVLLAGVLWEGKSPALLILNGAHLLVVVLVMSIILTLWRKRI